MKIVAIGIVLGEPELNDNYMAVIEHVNNAKEFNFMTAHAIDANEDIYSYVPKYVKSVAKAHYDCEIIISFLSRGPTIDQQYKFLNFTLADLKVKCRIKDVKYLKLDDITENYENLKNADSVYQRLSIGETIAFLLSISSK